MVSMLDEAEEATAGAEDWVETHSSTHPASSSAGHSSDIPEIPDLDPSPPASHSQLPDMPNLDVLTLDEQGGPVVAGDANDIPDMDDIPDMEDDDAGDFGGGLLEEEDEATVQASASGAQGASGEEGNLLAVRTYDVMIT